jgi:hypothetical protein
MRLSVLLLITPAVVLAGGCSDPQPPGLATTPEESRKVLVSILDAWKAGQTRGDLRDRSPPIYFSDEAMDRGRKLVDYTIDGDGVPMGTGLRYEVTLTLQEGDRPPATRKVAYRVVTRPNVSVSKEDF